jgi:cytidylate kinase
MSNPIFSIAIDGASGVGKSTVAKALSERLHILHLDTGAMYRAVGLYMLRRGVDLSDEAAIIAALPGAAVSVRYADGGQRTHLCGEDVTDALRTQAVGKAGSDVSKVAAVRERLVDMQREIARGRSIVMDGRDIGTHVLPDATLKIFLTADARVRAQRRVGELSALGVFEDEQSVLAQINERDHQDMTRAQSPLRMARDAREVKTDALAREEVVSEVLRLLALKREETP